MPTKEYKEPRECACGFRTIHPSSWCIHRKRCHLVPNEKDARIAALESQLAALDEDKQELKEQLAAKDRQIEELIRNLEYKAQKRHKTSNRRKSFPEPFRRKIAIRQNWQCANPDGRCIKLYLEEYDVDHITPLHMGGTDDPDNLQALCPACHRRKTEREACMQVAVSGSEVTGQEGVMVQ